MSIELNVKDGIAMIIMQRPKQRNSFSREFLAKMESIVAELSTREDIDAVILAGSDGAFSSGGDIKVMVERCKNKTSALEHRGRLYRINDWIHKLRSLPVPVISAVDGPAYGAGFSLSLVADFVLASQNASFCASFGRIGGIPDCGIFFALPRMIGMQRAKELLYTGRIIDAEEAKALGIIYAVHSSETLIEQAINLANRLRPSSKTAFAITKQIMNQSFDVDAQTIIDLEAAGQAICLTSEYHYEAAQRFVDKKPLHFNWGK